MTYFRFGIGGQIISGLLPGLVTTAVKLKNITTGALRELQKGQNVLLNMFFEFNQRLVDLMNTVVSSFHPCPENAVLWLEYQPGHGNLDQLCDLGRCFKKAGPAPGPGPVAGFLFIVYSQWISLEAVEAEFVAVAIVVP